MKFKLTALIFVFAFALSVTSWAQTATPSTPPSATPPSAASSKAETSVPADQKIRCACCAHKSADAKTTDAKEGHACCHHHATAAGNSSTENPKDAVGCCGSDDMKGCCGGKDAKACMRASTDKASESCCSGAMRASKDGKGCCASDKKGEMAMACCGEHAHCAMHDHMHDDADMNK